MTDPATPPEKPRKSRLKIIVLFSVLIPIAMGGVYLGVWEVRVWVCKVSAQQICVGTPPPRILKEIHKEDRERHNSYQEKTK